MARCGTRAPSPPARGRLVAPQAGGHTGRRHAPASRRRFQRRAERAHAARRAQSGRAIVSDRGGADDPAVAGAVVTGHDVVQQPGVCVLLGRTGRAACQRVDRGDDRRRHAGAAHAYPTGEPERVVDRETLRHRRHVGDRPGRARSVELPHRLRLRRRATTPRHQRVEALVPDGLGPTPPGAGVGQRGPTDRGHGRQRRRIRRAEREAVVADDTTIGTPAWS